MTMSPKKKESGFTLVEVMISVMILTIAMLALLPLLYVGTVNSLAARTKSEAVTIASDYIEQVRQMSYIDIGTVGGTPNGTLVASTYTKGPLQVTLTPTVSWVDDPVIVGTQDYKKLAVTVAVVARTASASFTYNTESYIRQDAYTGILTPPTVNFTSDSPNNMAVIWGSGQYDSNNNHVGVTATAVQPNTIITDTRIYCDGTLLYDASGGQAE